MPSSHWRRIQNLNGHPVRPRLPEANRITLRGLTLAEIEAYAIKSSVARLRKLRLVCQELGISKATLHRKMNALGLRMPQAKAVQPPEVTRRGSALVGPLGGVVTRQKSSG